LQGVNADWSSQSRLPVAGRRQTGEGGDAWRSGEKEFKHYASRTREGKIAGCFWGADSAWKGFECVKVKKGAFATKTQVSNFMEIALA
jgi:hypothetical protein